MLGKIYFHLETNKKSFVEDEIRLFGLPVVVINPHENIIHFSTTFFAWMFGETCYSW